jgi:CBS domain-containing protein
MEPDVTIREVMTREYVGVSESDSVLGVVRLLRDSRAASALVMRGSDVVGIVTEWDVLGLIAEEGDAADAEVADVMSSPIVSANAESTLVDAAATMAAENIRNLVVTEAGETVGVLTQRDVIAATGSLRQRDAAMDEELYAPSAAQEEGEGDVAMANGGTFRRQGICEACGALAESLREQNGELVCPNCQGV